MNTLKKQGPLWALLLLILGNYGLDYTGKLKEASDGQTVLKQTPVIDTDDEGDDGEEYPIDSLGFIELPPDPGNGDAGVWFIVDAVVTNEKKTQSPGLPAVTFKDNYILVDRFIFIPFEDPVPILEAANDQINPPAGGMITKVFRIRTWSG